MTSVPVDDECMAICRWRAGRAPPPQPLPRGAGEGLLDEACLEMERELMAGTGKGWNGFWAEMNEFNWVQLDGELAYFVREPGKTERVTRGKTPRVYPLARSSADAGPSENPKRRGPTGIPADALRPPVRSESAVARMYREGRGRSGGRAHRLSLPLPRSHSACVPNHFITTSLRLRASTT
jgi:hypothetical protein